MTTATLPVRSAFSGPAGPMMGCRMDCMLGVCTRYQGGCMVSLINLLLLVDRERETPAW